MIVEIHGLEVFGRHGVGEAERRDGQSFLFDVTLEVPEPREDVIDATVDYRAVRDAVRELSDARSYKLLESLAAAAADTIVDAFCSRLGDRTRAQAGGRLGGVDRSYSFTAAPVVTLRSYVALATPRARRTSA